MVSEVGFGGGPLRGLDWGPVDDDTSIRAIHRSLWDNDTKTARAHVLLGIALALLGGGVHVVGGPHRDPGLGIDVVVPAPAEGDREGQHRGRQDPEAVHGARP